MSFKRRAAVVASIAALATTAMPGIATAQQAPLGGLLGGSGATANSPAVPGAAATGATTTGTASNDMGLDLLGPLLGSGVTDQVRDPYSVSGTDVVGTNSTGGNTASGAAATGTQGTSSAATGTTFGANRDADAQYQQALESAMEGEIDTQSAAKVASGLTAMLPVVMSTAAQPTTIQTVSSGATCGIGMATAAAGMMASGAAAAGAGAATGGAGAIVGAPGLAAAAPVAAAAAPHCITATGGLMTSAGMLVAAYEDNPDLPQLVDVAAQLDPDTGLGRVAWENLPGELQTPENKAALKTFSSIAYSMSKVKLGQSLQAYGEVVYGIGQGDPSSLTQLVPVTLTLGTSLINAGAEGINGQPLALSVPGLTDVSNPTTTKEAQREVASKRQVSDAEINQVERIGSNGNDDDVDDNRSSRNGGRNASSERSSTSQRPTSTSRTTSSSSEPTTSSRGSGNGGSGNAGGRTTAPSDDIAGG